MNDRPLITQIPLPSKRPLSDREMLERLIESAVERSNDKVLGEMRAMNQNLERALSRILGTVDGVAQGEKAIAVAGVVEGAEDDLPRLSRIKADPALVYTLKTGAVATAVGLSTMRVSFLLNKSGLDWVGRQPELWSAKMHDVSGTRLWHPKTVALLKQVLDIKTHPERAFATTACLKFLSSHDRTRSA
jgi:hypothetical protein